MSIFKKKKADTAPGEDRNLTRWQEFLSQFMKNKGAVIAAITLLILMVIMIFAQFYYDFDTDICGISTEVLKKPSWEHPMGTDALGRDVMARLLYGGRWSISLAIISVIISAGLGTLYGAVATYIGGAVESIMFRISDAIMMIPSMLLVITLVSILGVSVPNLIIAMSFGGIPYSARLIRSTIMPIRNSNYVESARSLGVSNTRILFSYVLPNAISPVIVSISMRAGGNLLGVAAYSFLGLGVPLPIPEWGTMLSEARNYMTIRPDMIIYPGFMVLIFVLGFNLIGDGLRDALDPKQKL